METKRQRRKLVSKFVLQQNGHLMMAVFVLKPDCLPKLQANYTLCLRFFPLA